MTEIPLGFEEEIKFDNRDLAPIEHMLIGSTIEYRGQTYDSTLFLEAAKNGAVESDFLIPESLKNVTMVQDVNNVRMKEKRLVGLLPVFDPNFLVGISESGVDVGLELPLLDESGKIDPVWKIVFLNGDGQEVEYNNKIDLDDRFAPHFQVKQQTDGSRYLQFAPNNTK